MNMENLMDKYGAATKKLTLLATTAESSERFSEMCQFMSRLIKESEAQKRSGKKDLSVNERNMLSVAYKNVVGQRRASWRVLQSEDDADVGVAELRADYKKIIEIELEQKCREVLKLIEDDLLFVQYDIDVMKGDKESKDGHEFTLLEKESTIFYLKMCGDYYRYLAEFLDEDSVKDKAKTNYDQAIAVAATCLPPTHPTRLGLILNASVCMYEILKLPNEARALAKKGFDEAIQKLDSLSDTTYKDSTLIMQLLRDNLTIWTSAGDDEEDRED